MKYLKEFLKAVFGNWVLDVVGAGLVFASYFLALWAPTAVLAVALLYSSFRAFSIAAGDRDAAIISEDTRIAVSTLLAKGRAEAEEFESSARGLILIDAYEEFFPGVALWWSNLLGAVTELDATVANRLGLPEDIERARNPPRSQTNVVHRDLLLEFLNTRIIRTTEELAALR